MSFSQTWQPANQHIPISTTVSVKDGKEIRVERFADGREVRTERPVPKYISLDLEDYQ